MNLSKSLFLCTLLLCAVLTLFFAGRAVAEIKIGVLAMRGQEKVMTQWGPTADYLTNKIGEKVVIIPLKFEAIEPVVQQGKIDFMLANSAFFVEMEKKYRTRAVATLVNSLDGKPMDSFGGVIFVRQDSSIDTLEDIRGKKFMVVDFSSFGGGQMAWKLLLDKGIDPKKDTAAFLEGKKHDNVVLAVQNGVVDVGSVRTDTLERMQAEGKIKMTNFRIINQIKSDFPYVHSTILYPEWPLAALAGTSAELSAEIVEALKAITPNSPVALAASIYGWKDPADYSSVRECLKTIKFGAFAENN
jgi:phosphate/phosphite/phosphonate ABC transporter binding protein